MAEDGFRAFQRAKLSPQDTQLSTIRCIFLQQIKLSIEKTFLKLPLKKKSKIGFKTDYRLMQVKSIAECSKGGPFCNIFDLH